MSDRRIHGRTRAADRWVRVLKLPSDRIHQRMSPTGSRAQRRARVKVLERVWGQVGRVRDQVRLQAWEKAHG